MKIAISSDGQNLESRVDQRFGRCEYFLIITIDNDKIKEFTATENSGAKEGHGAGILSAQQIGELGVEVVITGQVGPNASKVLKELNVKTYSGSGLISEVVQKQIKGELKEIKQEESLDKDKKNEQQSKDKRIFFPLLKDKGLDSEISHHFGHAPFFGLYDTEKREFKVIKNNLDHTNPDKSPIDQIEETVNPTTIYAKGIGKKAITIIQEKGLRLKTSNFDTIREVIADLNNLKDQIEDCGHNHH